VSGIRKPVLMGFEQPRDNDEMRLLQESKDLIYHLTDSKRLLVKDLSEVSNIAMASKWIEKTREETGNDIVIVIDALNDLPINESSEYEKMNRAIEWMQSVVSATGACAICTAHTHKRPKKNEDMGSGEPHQSNIKGNNRIEFAGKIIASVYNEYHDVGPDKTKTGWHKGGVLMPALKVNFIKVKTFAGSKGETWFKMDTDSIQIKEASQEEIILPENHGGQFGNIDLSSYNEPKNNNDDDNDLMNGILL